MAIVFCPNFDFNGYAQCIPLNNVHYLFVFCTVMDSTVLKGMSPDYVAQRILRGIASQQHDMLLAPIHHSLSVYLRVLTPSIFDWIMRIRARSGMASEN